jgi:hypothetical protein
MYPTDSQLHRLLVAEHIERLEADARRRPRRRPLRRRIGIALISIGWRLSYETSLRPEHSTL